MKSKIIISSASKDAFNSVRGSLAGQEFSWVYLGQSHKEWIDLENFFNGQGVSRDTINSVHKSAQRLREPYLRYLYDIGDRIDKLTWWLTTLSYRSTYLSEVFLTASFLDMGLALMRDYDEENPLVLFVQKRSLYEAFKLNVEFVMIGRPEFIGSSSFDRKCPLIFDLLKVVVRRGYFVLREARRIMWADKVEDKFAAQSGAKTLLVSSVSFRSVDLEGDFHTYFFSDLAYKLTSWGRQVALMPLVLHNVPYLESLNKIRHGSFPVCIVHKYLKIRDLMKAALLTILPPPSLPSFLPLEGINITPLLKDDLRSNWQSNAIADSLIMSMAFARMADKGFEFEQIIYLFENQPWERAICWQVHKSFPNAELVGYQHSRAPYMLLNFFLADGGEPNAPLPDKLVTVGDYTYRLFSDDGWDPAKLRRGGALREYNSGLDNTEYRSVNNPIGIPTVLVAPSNGLEEARELVMLALDLYEIDEGVKVVFKCHPTMDFDTIGITDAQTLPAPFEVSNEDISTLMVNSSLMIYTGTSVCIPALAMGLPLIHVRRKLGLDLDPLEFVPTSRLQATTLEELREQVRWVIENREDYVQSNRQVWKTIAGDMFGEVTDESYAAFVN